MKKVNNRRIKKDIRKLKQEKKDYLKKSLSAIEIRQRVGKEFANEILARVRPSINYGEKRYLLEDIKKYLNHCANGMKIFVELVGGQACFIQPVGKNKQAKLYFEIK